MVHNYVLQLPITFRLGDFVSMESREILGTPPTVDLPQLTRYSRWSDYLSLVQHFASDWNFRTDQPPFGEKNVSHSSLQGIVDYGTGDDWYQKRCPSCLNFSVSRDDLGRDLFNGEGALSQNVVPAFSTGMMGTLSAFRAAVASDSIDHQIILDGAYTYDCYLREFNYLIGSSAINLWWTIRVDVTTDASPTEWCGQTVYVCQSVLRLRPRSGSGTPDYDTVYSLDDYFYVDQTAVVSYIVPYRNAGQIYTTPLSYESFEDFIGPRRTLTLEQYPSWEYSVSEYWTRRLAIRPRVSQTVENLIGYDISKKTFYSFGGTSDYTFRNFCSMTESLAGDAIGCTGLVASDAIDSSAANFSVNQFENLGDLGALFSLVDCFDLLEAARDMHGGKFMLSAMLDLLSSSRLVYSFALSNTYRDIQAVRDGASAFRHRWLTGGQFIEAPMYGGTKFDVPSDLTGNFEDVTVDVRVKIVGRFAADAVLYKVLPLDVVGVLPKLSSLWAAVPFSFAIDNLLNVEAALRIAENELFFTHAFDTKYSVVSWAFSWSPSTEKLQTLLDDQLGYFVGRDFGYRTYTRAVLPKVPHVGASRILESALAVRVPSDWMTYGALGYQLLR
jgi:hypothetical protein